MKVGDLVKYGYSRYCDGDAVTGLILYINIQGGTLKVVDKFGNIDWFVTSGCEVLSEAR